ncbi:hypothetical protein AAG570_005556 [Ranatra chinensis]|uniref:Major facilitator superfamily (MFS) profile domain-containing protein n=1 Tax=Ranatra chinensis TaxID=642074 RepID=A0ABD0XXS7_9HEMI
MFLELHFCLVSIATTIVFVWFIVPYFYLADHMSLHGYTEEDASFVLSVIGVTNTIGMIGFGWAGDRPWLNVAKAYAVCLFLTGGFAAAIPLATAYDWWLLLFVAAGFGAFFASCYSFTPPLLVELVPLDRFTTAYGLSLLCQGIGNLLGPPLAG